MTTNLRVSLAIFSVGFAVEGASDVYSVLSHGSFRPGANFLVYLPVAVTLLGLLFVWVGRHEWNELHRSRVRHAHRVFGASLAGAVIAGAIVGLLAYRPQLGVPLWAEAVFGAAVGSLVFGTFLTYVFLVFHLVGRPSQAVLIASVAWAFAVSALIGATLASNLGGIVALIGHREVSLPSFLAPVDTLSSYLFLSYFLLLAAYADAHRKVAAGRKAPPLAPGPTNAG